MPRTLSKGCRGYSSITSITYNSILTTIFTIYAPFTQLIERDIILPMYKNFYGLKENPFNVTSDPSFFFSSVHHVEAFSHLIYGIEHRKGILVLTGEIGTGKTTLCRALLNRLDNKTKTAFTLYPPFPEIQQLQLIIEDRGIEPPEENKNSN